MPRLMHILGADAGDRSWREELEDNGEHKGLGGRGEELDGGAGGRGWREELEDNSERT